MSTYPQKPLNLKPARAGHFSRYLVTVTICFLAIGLSRIIDALGSEIPAHLFLPLHLTLEYASVVIGFSVFVSAWFGYKQTSDVRDLIIGITFLLAGMFDFVHTLSYKGMPDFLGVNTVGKAAAYWLLGRLTTGIGLLIAVLMGTRPRIKRLPPRITFAVASGIVVTTVSLITLFGDQVSSMLYVESAHKLTILKISLEIVSIATYVAVLALVSEKRGWNYETASLLRQSLIVLIFAEIAFSLYADPYEWTNAIGHVLKSVTYYLILRALFVSAIQKPYMELSQAKEELQALYAEAQAQRQQLERSFVQIGSALASSLRTNETLDQIGDLAMSMLHADCSIVALVDRSSQLVQVTAQKGGCHVAERPGDLVRDLAIQMRASRKTLLINDVEHSGLVRCHFEDQRCLRAMICSPMVYGDEMLGLVAVYSYRASAFNENDVRLLEGFASHAAVAVHNALSYERESRIADQMQRSLLTPFNVVSGRFEIRHVYEPASEEARIGGDFYDVIELRNGLVGLVIGDISGKGLRAAVYTAAAKYTLRAYISEGHTPAEALRLMNETFDDFWEGEMFITIFVGLLDVETGRLIYANAGHEPPIYAQANNYTLLPTTGPAIGIGIHDGFRDEVLDFKDGSLLLLYTDGLSEARRDGVLFGTEGLGSAAMRCITEHKDDLARCIYSAALEFSGKPLQDDAAVLTVRAMIPQA